ncbi:MAG TPA: sigma-70 family RNA polymerase sigma factor [Pyrinomonadaceae bacterium]|nr:sigma-70 family RNA polymerase sigma factor [Pyrinomonadaceae bacterium]
MATETAHLTALMTAMMAADDFETPLDTTVADNAREHFALLVARARAGDAAAFERIMLDTERKVVATAWRMLGNREDARDAAQEVYLRVYKYLDRFKPEQDFNGWLYRITINVCRDAARKRRGATSGGGVGSGGEFFAARMDEGERAATPERVSPDTNAEENAIRAQQRSMLMSALETLPEKERAALVLRDLEGLTTEEVARVLRSRPVTVRSQISSARTKLKIHCARLLNKGGRTA